MRIFYRVFLPAVCCLALAQAALGFTFTVINAGGSSADISGGVTASSCGATTYSPQETHTIAAGSSQTYSWSPTLYWLGFSCNGSAGPWSQEGSCLKDYQADGKTYYISCPPGGGAPTISTNGPPVTNCTSCATAHNSNPAWVENWSGLVALEDPPGTIILPYLFTLAPGQSRNYCYTAVGYGRCQLFLYCDSAVPFTCADNTNSPCCGTGGSSPPGTGSGGTPGPVQPAPPGNGPGGNTNNQTGIGNPNPPSNGSTNAVNAAYQIGDAIVRAVGVVAGAVGSETAAVTGGSAGIEAAIGAAASGIEAAIYGTATNGVASGTNDNSQTNFLNAIMTNIVAAGSQGSQTGRLAGAVGVMQLATNAAGGLALDSLKTAASGLSSWDESEGSASSTAPLVSVPSLGFSFALSPAPYGWVSTLHSVASWSIWLWLFIANYKVFRAAVFQAALAPQGHAAGEAVLGTNVNFGSALVAAGLIVAALTVFVGIYLPDLVTLIGHIVGNPFDALTGFELWSWFCAAVPLGQLISAVGTHIVFRIGVDSAAVVLVGVIRFLVGL